MAGVNVETDALRDLIELLRLTSEDLKLIAKALDLYEEWVNEQGESADFNDDRESVRRWAAELDRVHDVQTSVETHIKQGAS